MGCKQNRVCVPLILCTLAASPSFAQQHREPTAAIYPQTAPSTSRRAKPAASHALTTDEGLAVLGAALESRARLDSKSDCSHLVHAIYERAGFPYEYASSSELYTGTDVFRRVASPQPGDLVVWPGHVGIAVNPAQHSFFSALRSGLGVDSYNSAYWKERGKPRFLRYVTDTPAGLQAQSSSRASSLKENANPESHSAIARNIRLATVEDDETDRSSPRSGSMDSTATTPPRFQLVHSKLPGPKDVSDALQEAYRETEEALRDQDVLSLPHPLLVFDEFSVERVHLQRDQGWADVRISGAVSISAGKPNSKKHAVRQHWPLVRQDHDAWQVTLPPEAICLPNDIVVRMVIHQLATLTEEAGGQTNREEKVELSRVLNVLLQK